MKKIIAILILTPIVGLAFLEKKDLSPKREGASLQELNDIIINTEGSGVKAWRLEASKAYIDSRDIATLYDLRFFSKNGRISASEGRYEIDTQKAEISGGVLIHLPDGSKARIRSLKVEDGKIKSDEPVVIERGNIILKGKGILFDTKTGRLKILKDVRLEIR